MTIGNPKTKADLWIFPLSDRKPIPLIETPFSEGLGTTFSPDGKWLAYASDESGEDQVYVRPFSGPSGKWQISTGGGRWPRWRKDGKEVFYLAHDNTWMAAEVKALGSAFEVGTVRKLFEANAYVSSNNPYDVTPDGQRFLINTNVEYSDGSPILLVVNWDEELKKK